MTHSDVVKQATQCSSTTDATVFTALHINFNYGGAVECDLDANYPGWTIARNS